MNRGTWIGNGDAAEKVSLTAWDDVLGFPGFEIETIQGLNMTVCDFYALTEQGFVYVGRAFGYDFDDAAEGDGAWPLDLTGDGRSELITRSTFGDGMSCVLSTAGTVRRAFRREAVSTGIRRTRSLRA